MSGTLLLITPCDDLHICSVRMLHSIQHTLFPSFSVHNTRTRPCDKRIRGIETRTSERGPTNIKCFENEACYGGKNWYRPSQAVHYWWVQKGGARHLGAKLPARGFEFVEKLLLRFGCRELSRGRRPMCRQPIKSRPAESRNLDLVPGALKRTLRYCSCA